METAEHLYRGVRKDGVTPEFAHQAWIASFVRTLSPMLSHPEAATHAGVIAFVERLGYDFAKGPVQAACRLNGSRSVILPAYARTPGEVYVTVLDGLEIADL